MQQPQPPTEMKTSTRDRGASQAAIQGWLEGRLPGHPKVISLSKPDGNGMSSDTLMFTVAWTEGTTAKEQGFVARLAPDLNDIPVFPHYDLERQQRVMALVAAETGAPVPVPRWAEGDPAIIGTQFFVMDRLEGQVPPDVLPYTFPDGNWLISAQPAQRQRLMHSAVEALAQIHQITPATHDLSFLGAATSTAAVIDAHLDDAEQYKNWVTANSPSPLLDECFEWLRANRPTDLGPTRLSWGDARIGNMLFVDFEVAGVLDWEMACLAPAEIDLGWMTYLHRFFQDLTTDLGETGLPDFMRPADVAAAYRQVTNTEIGDLRWPMAYAAVRHGAIMRRVGERMVAFGEREPVEDPDELIMHAKTLRQMIDGTYWDGVDLG